ncbi:hypothetical protein EWE75_01335 [Sphingomonas populi]|uniref:Uncharacterized protein n=1 Tax=Sphingomonas populi TaxID=2484750 RepID=A0A4Q6Y8Q0_9SPHN|nr:hypothetical protein [Sphingomonas populi]RZF66524.1 hypothetical protein EWE75_01335 [Sphingomonas populi]
MIDTAKVAMLRDMITWPSKVAIRDIIARRIYCIEAEKEYENPFTDPVEEMLFKTGLSIDRQYPKEYDEHQTGMDYRH